MEMKPGNSSASRSTSPGSGSDKEGADTVQDFEYPADLMVRNTFYDYPLERPPSLDGFYQDRQIKSAPGSKIEAVFGSGLSNGNQVVGAAPCAPPSQQVLPHDAVADQPFILRLADTLAEPVLGSAEMPTMGSAGHRLGQCKPCAFVYREEGCTNGVDCPFCHLCDSSEKKRRQKEKRTVFRMQRALTKGLNGLFSA